MFTTKLKILNAAIAVKSLDQSTNFGSTSKMFTKTSKILNGSSKSNFQQHLETMHNIKNFECEICAKKFETDYNLWKHIKSIHKRQLLLHKADCSPPCFHFNLNKNFKCYMLRWKVWIKGQSLEAQQKCSQKHQRFWM